MLFQVQKEKCSTVLIPVLIDHVCENETTMSILNIKGTEKKGRIVLYHYYDRVAPKRPMECSKS